MTEFHARADPASDSLRGIALMVFGCMLLTCQDAVIKWLVADRAIGQVIFLRSLFAIIPLILFVWLGGRKGSLRIINPRVHLVRAACAILASYLFIAALRYLPIAEAVAIAFTAPLFVTALSVPILGERVGWRRWTAVGVGFAGVLVIVRPSGDVIHFAVLLALVAALFVALRDLTTRSMMASESALAVLTSSTILIGLSGLVTLPFTEWRMLTSVQFGFLGFAGLLFATAHFCIILSFRYAPAAVIAPFKYSTMIWAVLLGWLVWRHVPDSWTILGTTILGASGLYILHREFMDRRISRRNHEMRSST